MITKDDVHKEICLLLRKKVVLVKMPKADKWRGVYMLIRDGRVVYIGQSVCIPGRISAHCSDKDFDEICFLPFNGDLDAVEEHLIAVFTPEYNRWVTKGVPIRKDSGYYMARRQAVTIKKAQDAIAWALVAHGEGVTKAFERAARWKPKFNLSSI
jgi:hypothetical protein